LCTSGRNLLKRGIDFPITIAVMDSNLLAKIDGGRERKRGNLRAERGRRAKSIISLKRKDYEEM
jgi:hypothetical protein